MVFTVANQEAGSGEIALVDETQIAVPAGRHDGCIEVDQVRVVCLIALRTADAVWVMAGVARCVFTADVLVVFPEALIVQYVVLAVAVVAELVRSCALLRVIGRFVPVHQDRLERGAVRPFRTCAPRTLCRTRIVAVTASNDRLLGQGADQARHVAVAPG